MGQFASIIVKGIDAVANDIASVVTDAGTTAGQLTDLAKQFTAPVLHRFVIFADPPPLTVAIKSAMSACQAAVAGFYKTQFGTDPGANVDNGCTELQ